MTKAACWCELIMRRNIVLAKPPSIVCLTASAAKGEGRVSGDHYELPCFMFKWVPLIPRAAHPQHTANANSKSGCARRAPGRKVASSSPSRPVPCSTPPTRGSVRPAPQEDEAAACRLQDLRHICATLLLLQDTHSKSVQELLRHATLARLGAYLAVIPGMEGHEARAMEDALREDVQEETGSDDTLS
jgi:hypothetical protein